MTLSTEVAIPVGPAALGPPDAHEWALLERQARAFANSGLVRRELTGRWEAVLLIALTGRDFGLSPTVALRNVYVVDNVPSMSANLIAAIIRRDGHRIGVRDDFDDQHATAYVQRWDVDGWGEVHELTWTIEMAQRANLLRKDNWKNYPAAMLRARAISAIGRLWCQDSLLGGVYTPDELGAIENPNGQVSIPAGKAEAAGRLVDRAADPVFSDAAAGEEIPDAEIVEEPDYATPAEYFREIDAIAALFGQTRRTLTNRWAIAHRRNIEEATPKELHEFVLPWRERAADEAARQGRPVPGTAAPAPDRPEAAEETAGDAEVADAEIVDAETPEAGAAAAAEEADPASIAERAHLAGDHADAPHPDCPACAGV